MNTAMRCYSYPFGATHGNDTENVKEDWITHAHKLKRFSGMF